ncbi:MULTISPECIES: TasA family protein [unclassified Holdemania]|uniref:TasA family protein n=1 Tax=unclassified Holdemania TaxID=2637685 RepID=UPI0009341F35|nr:MULTISPECIES: TasA family protein [unclassified Holdemania]
MKKKILSLCLVVALAATAVIGGTLAYFSDTDAQKNTFTTGKVAIDLWEDFGDNDAQGIEELIPATGSAQAGTLKNGIEKEVYVDNIGTEDAYVRVHIAVPAILDDGDPSFNAAANTLHWNFQNYGNKSWNWTATANAAGYDAKDWNFYTITIDDIKYNVYVATYETILKNGETTPNAIHQVYLDSKTTNENIEGIKNVLGDNWYIYVAAEGTQAAGFNNAYEALNTAFGDPTDSAYTSKIDWKTVSGKTWVDTEATVNP